MFESGLDGMGNLINTAAIAMLRRNTADAVNITMGRSVPFSTTQKVIEAYVRFVTPRAGRALLLDEILHDPNFQSIVEANREGGAGAKDLPSGEGWGLFNHAVTGVPNWLLYGAVAGLGYWYYKNHKKVAGVVA